MNKPIVAGLFILIVLFSYVAIAEPQFIVEGTSGIAAWINSTGYLNVSGISVYGNGNVTANYFFGNNIKYILKSINLTPTTYNGSLVNGSYVGYDAANNICNASFSNSHFCSQNEIMENIILAKEIGNADGWIMAGGPKYIPATIPVDDCFGFRYDLTATHLGSYWKFNSTMGGYGAAINCGTSINLTCCVIA